MDKKKVGAKGYYRLEPAVLVVKIVVVGRTISIESLSHSEKLIVKI